MEFRIADTLTASLARLTGEEQKAVKTTAFDLQLNPANPGMQFHRIENAKDKRFWSVRVSRDIRLIVHKTDADLLLCYVGHHDQAYAWAERRKVETHPKTGAAQLVEIRETVREIAVPVYVQAEAPESVDDRPVLSGVSTDELLECGVPEEWIDDVRAASDKGLLGLVEHLPAEAGEAVLELATGGTPQKLVVTDETSPFDHPDAQRRFRVLTNVDELQAALDYPWEKWAVFLHPEQRDWVEREHTGPSRVSGSAGTGKTIVALHRAAHLARANQDVRVLLTTFSDALATSLQAKLRLLLVGEPRLAEQIDVYSLNAMGRRLYEARNGKVAIASRTQVRELIEAASKEIEHSFTQHFLLAEWEQVVDAWQLRSWEAYRDVVRLGRKTRLPESQRETLWSIYEGVRARMADEGLMTYADLFSSLASAFAESDSVPFDHVVVDEAQDISVTQLQFVAALGKRPDALFFAGDLGQRIFQQPFSWKSLGVDIRGRSRTLRVNYRTSHQIRSQADRLLGPSVTDVDGNEEDRSDTVSVFNGPPPEIRSLESEADEIKSVGEWLTKRVEEGVVAHEIGVFVRSSEQIDRARFALDQAGLPFKLLDESIRIEQGQASISTMHLAKGLEFRTVVVMGCDDEVVPLQDRIEQVGDDSDLREVYDTERHLLYVACTRARDHLLVTCVEPGSEFLDDMDR